MHVQHKKRIAALFSEDPVLHVNKPDLSWKSFLAFRYLPVHQTDHWPVNPIQLWFQLSCLRWWCWGVYVGYLGKCASVNISLISVTQGQCLWDTLEEAPRLCKSFLATLTRDSFQTQEQWWPRQIPPMASSPWDSTLWRCGRILEGDMTGLLGQGEGQRDEEGEG